MHGRPPRARNPAIRRYAVTPTSATASNGIFILGTSEHRSDPNPEVSALVLPSRWPNANAGPQICKIIELVVKLTNIVAESFA